MLPYVVTYLLSMKYHVSSVDGLKIDEGAGVWILTQSLKDCVFTGFFFHALRMQQYFEISAVNVHHFDCHVYEADLFNISCFRRCSCIRDPDLPFFPVR